MIKGHTKIELFDDLTGKLHERVEDDNMFTNAISKMVNHALKHNFIHYRRSGATGGLNYLFNAHLDLVSGLLLFDTALDSDPDNVWAPASAGLTACGATGKVNGDASVPMMGSYNSAESVVSGLTRSWVWDFATNQGNGTIATACLTSNKGGYMGYGDLTQMGTANVLSDPYNSISLGNIMDGSQYGTYFGENNANLGYSRRGYNFVPFCIDDDNDLVYAFRITSEGKLEICSYKMSLSKFDLFRDARSIHPGTVEVYNGSFSSDYYWHFYNTDEQTLYFWGRSTNSASIGGETWTINKFDMQTKTLTTGYDTCVWNSNHNVTIPCVAVTANGVYGKPYLTGLQNKYVKHTRGGGSGFTEIDMGTSFNNALLGKGSFVIGGSIYFGVMLYQTNSNAARQMLLRVSDDTPRYNCLLLNFDIGTNTMAPRVVPPINNKQMVFYTGQQMGDFVGKVMTLDWNVVSTASSAYFGCGNTFTLANYLATKNVLPSPITKDATKTMKVTYTINGEELE